MSIPNCQFISNLNDESAILKEAKDSNLLSQDSKLTSVNLQLKFCVLQNLGNAFSKSLSIFTLYF